MINGMEFLPLTGDKERVENYEREQMKKCMDEARRIRLMEDLRTTKIF
jgi:hypothetical protein